MTTAAFFATLTILIIASVSLFYAFMLSYKLDDAELEIQRLHDAEMAIVRNTSLALTNASNR